MSSSTNGRIEQRVASPHWVAPTVARRRVGRKSVVLSLLLRADDVIE
jgi:hypothetical protein